MGYIRHHAILVTSGLSTGQIEAAHAKAVGWFGHTVSAIIESHINGYKSFAVMPDGSKEGWDESDRGDIAREAFVAFLISQRYEDNSSPCDWVEVQYGDDERQTLVVRHSDDVPLIV
jgi:hypothetical protein